MLKTIPVQLFLAVLIIPVFSLIISAQTVIIDEEDRELIVDATDTLDKKSDVYPRGLQSIGISINYPLCHGSFGLYEVVEEFT